MPSQRTRTALYTEAQRRDLARAIVEARQFAGWDTTTDLIKAVGRGPRAIYALENAEPTVGHAILSAVGRTLGTRVASWTADTPRQILEGNPPPPLMAVDAAAPAPTDGELPEDERQSFVIARDFMRTQGRELTVHMWRTMRDEYEKLEAMERSPEAGRAR